MYTLLTYQCNHTYLIDFSVGNTYKLYLLLSRWVSEKMLFDSQYLHTLYIYVSVNNVYVYVICMYICIYIYIFLLNLGVHPPFSDSPKGITLRLPGEGLDVNEGATPPSGGCGMRLDPNT